GQLVDVLQEQPHLAALEAHESGLVDARELGQPVARERAGLHRVADLVTECLMFLGHARQGIRRNGDVNPCGGGIQVRETLNLHGWRWTGSPLRTTSPWLAKIV